ncbi:DUF2059 domain-containing protein [Thermodesulfobacteriota bacterium]
MIFTKVNRLTWFYRFLILILLSLMITACATSKAVKESESGHIAAAKRFLRSFNAEELAMVSFKRTMESETKKHPESVVEVVQRAMSDVKGEDFIDIITQVYVRHLTERQLNELAQFAESPTGQHFFQIAIKNVLEGNRNNAQSEFLSKFNADELTEIMKFASGDAFQAMNKAQPEINREMSEAARKFSQEKMQEYLEKQ